MITLATVRYRFTNKLTGRKTKADIPVSILGSPDKEAIKKSFKFLVEQAAEVFVYDPTMLFGTEILNWTNPGEAPKSYYKLIYQDETTMVECKRV